MPETKPVNPALHPAACGDTTVYLLEGNPDEAYDAQGNRIELTAEQKKELEAQL